MIHARSKRVALRTTPRWGIATLLCAAIGISCATGPRYSEFSPTISADDRMMIFQSDREKRHRFRLYYKQKIDGRWREPVFMEGLGAVEGDGGPFITYDQNYLVFSSLRKGGAGNLDLWISQRLGTTWGPPVNMGAPINSSGYDGFGTISPDGKTIFFVRQCPEKKHGGEDSFGIFFSVKDDAGKWTEPKKMPAPVNGEYSDFGPVILADNLSLIFSSNRPGGLGKYDLYKTERLNDGQWTEPVNLGPGINTSGDDMLVSIPASGSVVYFGRTDNEKDDIYRIHSMPIPEKLQHTTVLIVRGTVRDKRDPSLTLAAGITITDTRSDEKPITIRSNEKDGAYIVILKKGTLYDVAAACPGYTFHSQRIDLTKLEKFKETEENILLEPLTVGTNLVLNNLFFKYKSYALLPASKYELQRVKKLMDENPTLRIEIGGHTDTIGPKRYNMKLSQQRAQSVVDYLAEQGVAKERLDAKGYGPDKPIGDNETEEGKEKNRRVEIMVLEK